MPLTPGTHLGPYELLAPLGAGGMGEVWRARDAKLGREVAIKVLPEAFAQDADRLARLEQEARTLSTLNHPNILTIHDLGRHEGAPYLVMELLEGETLRERMGGRPLPARRAVELALQIAQGLAAAHEKGIIHRDLKPENVFLTKDGRAKVLDFGLAKLRPAATGSQADTQAFLSSPGTLVGTTGYMSPEQVRGEALDARSDLFSLGVVLWEMLTGRNPFRRDHGLETMHAILKDELPEPEDTGRPLPLGVRRILDHCLEKDPARRFHDAQDLAFALENALGSTSSQGDGVPLRPAVRVRAWRSLGALALVLVLATGLGIWFLRPPRPAVSPIYKVLTFRRGNIVSARFTPDGQGIVYAAAWEGRPAEIFFCRADGTGTRALGLSQASVQAVGARGELLILLKPNRWGATNSGWGTLALSSLDGGMPKELLAHVVQADFGPGGQVAAHTFSPEGGRHRLEFPLGRTLLETEPDSLGAFRVSPDGSQVAVILQDADGTKVVLVDRNGARRDLYRTRKTFGAGLVWTEGGRSLVFLEGNWAPGGSPLLCVDLRGRVSRLLTDSSLGLVWDASPQGRLLLERSLYRTEAVVRRKGQEQDLCLGIHTFLTGLSGDGEWALLVDASSFPYRTYLRRTDGAPPKALGPGGGPALSPDGAWALLIDGMPGRPRLVPAGLGQERALGWAGLDAKGGTFSPDGRTAWVLGTDAQARAQAIPFDLDGRPGRPVPLPTWNLVGLSPSGDRFLWTDRGGRAFASPLPDGAPLALPWSLDPEEVPAGWDRPGEVLVRHPLGGGRERVDILDPATGRRSPFGAFGPRDPAGIIRLDNLVVSRDRSTVGLTYSRVVHSDLLLGEGLVPAAAQAP